MTQEPPGSIVPVASPDAPAWLAACPCAAVLFELGAQRPRAVAANAEAARLCGVGAHLNGDGAAVLERLEDAREPVLAARLGEVGRTQSPASVKLLVRRSGEGGTVLLEGRLAPVGARVALFLREAEARGATAVEATAAQVQDAIFEIARATHEEGSLEALFARIHEIVARLIGVNNFYIALVDEREQLLRFVYSRDEFDKHRPDRRLGLGVTDLVYLTGQPLLLDRSTANRMLEEGQVINHGVPAQVWLGVPLKVAGRTVGVMAVQDYHNPHFLGERERRLLGYLSDQIANAIAIKRAVDEAEQARAEARRAGRVKADFVATMSHELRTPLAVVIGFGELLQESLAGTPEAKQAASIAQAGHRLLAAVNQLLDFSQADGQAQPVHEEEVPCGEWLESCAAFFTERAAQRGIALSVRRDGYVPEALRTDPRILRQIVVSLLSNAVKFTPAGGRVTLAVRAEPVAPFHGERQRFVFSVEDTGPGMSEEKLARLFQPFEEAGRPVPGEGAGLGLAIAQRLAGLLGGRIAVRSAPGAGSVFSLALVTEAKTGGELADVAARLSLLLRSQIDRRGTEWPVLVVDPEPEGRAVISGMIESVTGRPARAVADATEAQRVVSEGWPAVVLVHACAPALDGPRLCAALRDGTGPARGGCCVIAYSVDHAATLVQACLAAGADDFLPKPVSRLSLVQALRAAFEATH